MTFRCALCLLLAELARWLGCTRAAQPLTFTAGGFSTTGVNLIMRMNNEQSIDVSIAPVTAKGNPAAIDGNASFAANPPEAGLFEQLSATSARFTPATGFVGAAQVVVTADADLEAGDDQIRAITASGALEIVAPEADHFEVTFGEPA